MAARHRLADVTIDYQSRLKISQICSELNVDGLRGDIVTNRASQAIAAFENRNTVTPYDILRVIPLCLRHRLRKDPLEGIDTGDKVRETCKKVFGITDFTTFDRGQELTGRLFENIVEASILKNGFSEGDAKDER